ncbi:hypothetical protein [Stenotrophomonas maltophilia]|uniref:hypothetical protein n=1 Tax=Stenotrophomonas maltophilia TaxID=40324 RepID=UPI0007EFACD4|nr:hypothetical protein [Stenotrophomonas maltophilia]OBU51625.1 hypothetical protein A9K76_03305 [Stenotrophomonas maltophilia]
MLAKMRKLKERGIVQGARQGIRVRNLLRKFGPTMAVGALAGAFALTLWATNAYEEVLQPRLSSKEGYQALTSLLVGLGCAMAGATAIVFTLVLFATQTNVARMPTELFRMFSSDRRLLGAFVGTMILSILIAMTTIVAEPSTAIWQLFGATWAIALILLTFVLAYQRALSLVNPTVQSQVAAYKATRSLKRWAFLADKLTAPTEAQMAEGLDAKRYAFLAKNSGWERRAQEIVGHMTDYGARLAEQGDHDSFRSMLLATISVHKSYVSAKGKTFVPSNPIFEVKPSRDAFQISTLESLRRAGIAALARKDERQAMLVFQALHDLFHVYLQIEYGVRRASKTHAAMVAGYLRSQVVESLSHGIPDVTMEGARQLGRTAMASLKVGLTEDALPLIKALGELTAAGVAGRQLLPVTNAAAEQLRDCLLVGVMAEHETGFSLEDIHQQAISATMLIMVGVKESSPVESIHRGYLSPYFSISDHASLLPMLAQLLSLASHNGAQVGAHSVSHFLDWVERIRHPTKDLMLSAFKLKSSLVFDLLNWPVELASILLRLAGDATHRDRAHRLLDEADKVAAMLTWVPTDKDAAHQANSAGYMELLMRLAIEAKKVGAEEVYSTVTSQLLKWSIARSKAATGWAELESAVVGLVGLELAIGGKDINALEGRVKDAVIQSEEASSEVLKNAAAGVAREAAVYRNQIMAVRISEQLLGAVGQAVAADGLRRLAAALDELSRRPREAP